MMRVIMGMMIVTWGQMNRSKNDKMMIKSSSEKESKERIGSQKRFPLLLFCISLFCRFLHYYTFCTSHPILWFLNWCTQKESARRTKTTGRDNKKSDKKDVNLKLTTSRVKDDLKKKQECGERRRWENEWDNSDSDEEYAEEMVAMVDGVMLIFLQKTKREILHEILKLRSTLF